MEAVGGAQAQLKPVAYPRRSRVVAIPDRDSDQGARNEPVKGCQRRFPMWEVYLSGANFQRQGG
jgi:hypothetical protein